MRKSLRDSTQLIQTIQKPLHNILRIREFTVACWLPKETLYEFRDAVVQFKIFSNALNSDSPKYQNGSISNPIMPVSFAEYFSKQFDLYEANSYDQILDVVVEPDLDRDISFDELSKCKALGSDGIPNEV
jgi:hypothetical protein